MTANSIVRARIDRRIKENCRGHRGNGLFVCDAFRLMIVRIARGQSAVPFEPMVPKAAND